MNTAIELSGQIGNMVLVFNKGLVGLFWANMKKIYRIQNARIQTKNKLET